MRKENLKLLIVLIVAVFLRLVNLNQSFWLDEAAQVIESSRSFLQQFDLAADFHPPLYHLLLHFWLYFGRSEIWVRLLSVGFGIGSIIVIYKTGKFLLGKKAALISAIFLTLSPYHIWYSQETRPYMAFLFFSLASTYFLLKKNWARYTVMLLFSLFTNYFTFFLITGHLVYVVFFEKKYVRSWVIYLAVVSIPFIFWLPEFMKQLTIGTSGLFAGWNNVVSTAPVKTAFLTFAKFTFGRGTFENKYLYLAIIGPVICLFVISMLRIWKSKQGKILAVLFFVPYITSLLVSIFVPIDAPQRLIFLLPIFYLILAYGIACLTRRIYFLAFLIIIATSMGGISQYFIDPNVRREDWRDAVSFVEKSADGKSVALFVFPGPFAPYTWYAKGIIDAWGIAPQFILTDADLNSLAVKLYGKDKVYLFQYLTDLTDPSSKTDRLLQSEGYKQTTISNFPGVGFVYTYVK